MRTMTRTEPPPEISSVGRDTPEMCTYPDVDEPLRSWASFTVQLRIFHGAYQSIVFPVHETHPIESRVHSSFRLIERTREPDTGEGARETTVLACPTQMESILDASDTKKKEKKTGDTERLRGSLSAEQHVEMKESPSRYIGYGYVHEKNTRDFYSTPPFALLPSSSKRLPMRGVGPTTGERSITSKGSTRRQGVC